MNDSNSAHQNVKTKKRVPKRILHFSDGVLEEYSTDEEEREERKREAETITNNITAVNTAEMSWIPWLMYLAWMTASSGLSVCDNVGEKLAWWLGITSPKYYYEIQEAKRMLKEEEERKTRMDAEMAGWSYERGAEDLVRSQEEVRQKERSSE